jgi:hypothetical protein
LKKNHLKLSSEDRLILSGTKLNPGKDDIEQIAELIPLVKDWEYLAEQAIHNGVGPVVYKNFSSTDLAVSIPADILSKLKQSYYRSLSRNMMLYDHFRNVINAISTEGIEVIALKGIYLAEAVYNDIGLRQMTDIDLLVKKEDAEKCRNILMVIGYADTSLDVSERMKELVYHKHLPPLVKDGVSVELHTHIHVEYPDVAVNIHDYWKRSEITNLAGVQVNILSNEDLLQHLCLHVDEHFDDGKPQLNSYLDIASVVELFPLNWQAFADSCNQYNCTNRIFRQLFLAHNYFNAQIPGEILSLSKSYVDNRIERLFIHYLQHHRKNVPLGITNRNIELLKNRKGFKNKILYVLHDMFPARSYMYGRYRIKRKYFLVWFYIYRLMTGIYKLIMELFRLLTPSAKSKT